MLLLLSQVKRESNRRATERYLENIHTLATLFRLFCKVYLCFPTRTRFGGFWFCVFAFLKCDYLHININGPVVFKALIRGYKLVALFYLVLLFDSHKVFQGSENLSLSTIYRMSGSASLICITLQSFSRPLCWSFQRPDLAS